MYVWVRGADVLRHTDLMVKLPEKSTNRVFCECNTQKYTGQGNQSFQRSAETNNYYLIKLSQTFDWRQSLTPDLGKEVLVTLCHDSSPLGVFFWLISQFSFDFLFFSLVVKYGLEVATFGAVKFIKKR